MPRHLDTKQVGYGSIPSIRAFVLKVFANKAFSKANFELFVGHSSEKYLTATRFPSESRRRMFFTEGQQSYKILQTTAVLECYQHSILSFCQALKSLRSDNQAQIMLLNSCKCTSHDMCLLIMSHL